MVCRVVLWGVRWSKVSRGAVGPVGYHGALLGGVSRSGVSRGVGKM